MQLRVRDLPNNERPRERLSTLGAHSLSLRELLEIILGQGGGASSVLKMSEELVKGHGNVSKLDAASVAELCQIKGVGFSKACQIKAAFELGKRFYREDVAPNLGSALTPLEAYKLCRNYLKDKKKEHLMLFCLDVRGKLISHPETISIGTLDCSLVHSREIFSVAMKNYASRILLAHNHPSGATEPSDGDLEATRKVFEAGNIIGIPLLDHIIIGSFSYTSLREQNPEVFETELPVLPGFEL